MTNIKGERKNYICDYLDCDSTDLPLVLTDKARGITRLRFCCYEHAVKWLTLEWSEQRRDGAWLRFEGRAP